MKNILLFLFIISLSFSALEDECTKVYEFNDLKIVQYNDFGTCEDDTIFGLNEDFYLADRLRDDISLLYNNAGYDLYYNEIALDGGSGVDEQGYYFYYPDFSHFNTNKTITFVGNGDFLDSPNAQIYFITEFGTTAIADDTTYNTITLNVTQYNSTHLKFVSTIDYGGGTTNYLEYNNGTSDSYYLHIFIDDVEPTTTYIGINMDVIPKTNLNSISTVTPRAFYGESKLFNTYRQYQIKGNKIFDIHDRSKQYLCENCDYTVGFTTLCKSYILGEGALLTPKLSYIVDDGGTSEFLMAGWYDDGLGASYQPNNTVMYILDTSNNWWLVPAVTCSGSGISSDTPSFNTAVFDTTLSAGTSSSGTFTAPSIPTSSYCLEDGNLFNISFDYPTSHSFLVSQVFCNGTYVNNTCVNGTVTYNNTLTTSNEIDTSILTNQSNLTHIYFYVNNIIQCTYANGTSGLLGLDMITEFQDSDYDIFKYAFFLMGMGVSSVIPFFIIFPITFNDVFGLITTQQMAFATILVGFLPYLSGWKGEHSLKHIIFLTVFAVVLISGLYETAGISDELPESFDNFNEARENMYLDIISADIWGLSVSAPTLVVNLLVFLLDAPNVLGILLLQLINGISPEMANAFNIFLPAILIGLVAYLIIKAFEILSNKYLKV